MTPLRLLLAALGFVALALAASPAMAHGGHAHAVEPALQDVPLLAHVHHAPALALPSPCPADDGGNCCCQGDRCTNPSQQRVFALPAPQAGVQPVLSPERPRVAAHPIAVAHAQPVGAVGSRGPPVNSWR